MLKYYRIKRLNYLLSMFRGTSLPLREGSHGLENETSTWFSFSTITLKLVALILITSPFFFFFGLAISISRVAKNRFNIIYCVTFSIQAINQRDLKREHTLQRRLLFLFHRVHSKQHPSIYIFKLVNSHIIFNKSFCLKFEAQDINL